ncbi:MAG: protein kinase, partial [Actinobacteria bacterium]|nr:protein kinase [Actinomycetota bacterium]
RGAQGPAQALDWLGEAARALDAAHRHGVVHRDVKPANLLLDRGGELHVVDFGIASAAGLDSFTKPGTVLGTAGYLSPEQAQGAQTTPASDRYALGVVAFELLAGTRPFERESPTAEAMAHVSALVPAISSRRPSLPPELDRVFERALAKEPEERYPSCAEFVSALRAALAEAAGATMPLAPVDPPTGRRAAEPERRSPPVPVSLRRSRRRWPILLAGLLAAGAGGVALAAALTSGDDTDRVATPESSHPVASTTRAKAPRPTTRIVVVTQPGTTEQVTVTVAPPSTEPPAPTTSEVPSEPADTETAEEETASVSTGSARDGVRLTDESTGLIRRGRYSEALPLAQSALASLQGSGQLYEAYANYNVGKSLLGVGRCAEALPFLDCSEAIQGRRAEITRDRAAAQRCA